MNLRRFLLPLTAALSLISQATMSIGAVAVLTIALADVVRKPEARQQLLRLTRTRSVRVYGGLVLLLLLSFSVSWISAAVDPLVFEGKSVPSAWHAIRPDVFKFWYFLIPPATALLWIGASEALKRNWIRTWLGTAAVLSLIGFQQYFTGWPRHQRIPGQIEFHATLFAGHHLSVASMLLFPWAMFLGIANSPEFQSRFRVTQAQAWTGCILVSIAIFLTYARSAWIALPVGFLIWGLSNLSGKKRWIFGVVLALGAGLLSQHPSVAPRIQTGMGYGQRYELWSLNFDFFKARPLFGVGPFLNKELSCEVLIARHSNPDAFCGHAHNNFLHQLAASGGVGTAIWLAIVGAIWVLLLRNRAKLTSGVAAAFACAWLVFQLNGMTQVNFWEGKVMHSMMLTFGLLFGWISEERTAL